MITNLKALLSEINKRFISHPDTVGQNAPGNMLAEIDSGREMGLHSKNTDDADDGFKARLGIHEGALVPIVGLALMILICVIAFVWGANSAKRKDHSYMLKKNNRNNRQYLTFAQQSKGMKDEETIN